MKTALFDYALPERCIAVRPLPERDAARLLVVGEQALEHRAVKDFAELVPEGALVVLNDTRVRRARVLATRRGSGGKIELLLLERVGQEGATERWQALGRANKPLRVGTELEAPGLEGRIEAQGELLEVSLRVEGGVEAWLERAGHVPIPPYLGRLDEPSDGERYQTVFAEKLGSAAAPTAGLHLTEAALARLRERGVAVSTLTLAIGLGTFRPVEAEDLDEHSMHSETLDVSPALVTAVAEARSRGAPIVAVGTTVVRALETAADPARLGHVRAFSGATRLLIQPGYAFRVVDALLTNFHQPRSTLLALVSAFAGHARVLEAYGVALREGYRFLSYGDAMWLPRRA
ncbi:MAG TPA: tRNA preQ1(34) S-adenosylmethionine ribosyltransferase-isomerase QueA [Polyangiaceae bacterium]|nr:tRNA preQ1(34) S-adenosylmethionine ribosyltransferase-isomerase QueA [Polyangiaceae bacterium]